MPTLNQKLAEMGDDKTCPAVAVVRGGHLLVGLRHYTPDKWKSISVWTFPGGRCDAGETLGVTLRREVMEETGIAGLRIAGFLGMVDGAKEGDRVPLFWGTTDQEPKLMEPEKFSQWCWKSIDAIPENFINPEILALVRKFLREGRV